MVLLVKKFAHVALSQMMKLILVMLVTTLVNVAMDQQLMIVLLVMMELSYIKMNV